MNSIDKLSEIFAKFPGIGPRQARRFVYFLLSRTGNYTSELVQAVQDIKKEIIQCTECMRFFAKEALGHSVSKLVRRKAHHVGLFYLLNLSNAYL